MILKVLEILSVSILITIGAFMILVMIKEMIKELRKK